MKLKKRISIFLGIALVAVLMLSACTPAPVPSTEPSSAAPESTAPASSEAAAESTAPAENGTKKIGFINAFVTSPYMGPVDAAAEAKAKELGVELQIVDGKADNQVMMDQAISFIQQKVDAIIICPADMAGSVTIVKKVTDAKIPLIVANARVDASVENLASTGVYADPTYEGQVVGEMVAKMFPDGGKAAIIEGFAGTEAQIARTDGFKKGIAGTPIEVVQQQIADWDRAKAMSAADDMITSIPDLKIIFAQDDNMALGAVEAVKAAGKLDQISVFGLGYMGDEAKNSLKAGELKGTCTQSPSWEGATAVQKAVDAINGVKLEKWYKTECVAVTKDNCDSIEHGYNVK